MTRNYRIALRVPARDAVSSWLKGPLPAIGMIALLGVPIAHAQSVPPAEATVWSLAARDHTCYSCMTGPSPEPLSASSSAEDSWTSPYGTSYWTASSEADVSFTGSTISEITARGYVKASGYGAAATGMGGGEIEAYFRLAPIQPAPFASAIPMTFEAAGSASISGYGLVSVFAHVLGASGFPYNDFQFIYEGVNYSRSFSSVAEFTVAANVVYTVLMGATADAYASAYPWETNSSTVTAWVDPVIGLDQAAFDRLYGSDAFQLSNYYSIELSPNLFEGSVPEPSSWVMLAFGLCAVGLLHFRVRGRSGARTAFVMAAGSHAANSHAPKSAGNPHRGVGRDRRTLLQEPLKLIFLAFDRLSLAYATSNRT